MADERTAICTDLVGRSEWAGAGVLEADWRRNIYIPFFTMKSDEGSANMRFFELGSPNRNTLCFLTYPDRVGLGVELALREHAYDLEES